MQFFSEPSKSTGNVGEYLSLNILLVIVIKSEHGSMFVCVNNLTMQYDNNGQEKITTVEFQNDPVMFDVYLVDLPSTSLKHSAKLKLQLHFPSKCAAS